MILSVSRRTDVLITIQIGLLTELKRDFYV